MLAHGIFVHLKVLGQLFQFAQVFQQTAVLLNSVLVIHNLFTHYLKPSKNQQLLIAFVLLALILAIKSLNVGYNSLISQLLAPQTVGLLVNFQLVL
jgi:hypothetical protein